MFNSFRAGRLLSRPRAVPVFQFMMRLFFCAALWTLAHYEFGFNMDRVHSRGSRLYRVNSYEQFIKEKVGDGAFLMA